MTDWRRESTWPEHYNSSPTQSAVSRLHNPELTLVHIYVSGITCASCAGDIKDTLLQLHGVERVSISVAIPRTTVVYRPVVISPERLADAIRQLGYGAHIGRRSGEDTLKIMRHGRQLQDQKERLKRLCLLCVAVGILETLGPYIPLTTTTFKIDASITRVALSGWVQIIEAAPIHRTAWMVNSRWWPKFHMDLLISLSLILGLALSCFNMFYSPKGSPGMSFMPGCMLTAITVAGRILQASLKGNSLHGLSSLYDLQNASASSVPLLPTKTLIPAILLSKGDKILIHAGRIVPCDCFVLTGASLVDQSALTGEHLAVRKDVGSLLMAGTKNMSADLTAVVVRELDKSSLQQLIDSATSATEILSNDTGLIHAITQVFVQLILALTFITFSLVYLASSRPGHQSQRVADAVEYALPVLTVACPCSLGMAVPSAFHAALSESLKRGILLIGGFASLERVREVTHVVMDKTGTLTVGELAVYSYHLHKETPSFFLEECLLLCVIEGAERTQSPTGRALFQWALQQTPTSQRHQLTAAEIREARCEIGEGVSGQVRLKDSQQWRSVCVGSATFFRRCRIPLPVSDPPSHAGPVAYFAFDGIYCGAVTFQDTIRSESVGVIEKLQRRGIHVSILTGDNYHEAQRVSNMLRGIEILQSGATPSQKAEAIAELNGHGSRVAMIGDGLNDLPAQAIADVGIVLSLPGSQNTGAAADIIILSGQLDRLVILFDIAGRTVRQARWNIIWAGMYNLVAIALAAGAGKPWGINITVPTAATLMAASSAIVLSSGLWLQRSLKSTM